MPQLKRLVLGFVRKVSVTGFHYYEGLIKEPKRGARKTTMVDHTVPSITGLQPISWPNPNARRSGLHCRRRNCKFSLEPDQRWGAVRIQNISHPKWTRIRGAVHALTIPDNSLDYMYIYKNGCVKILTFSAIAGVA